MYNLSHKCMSHTYVYRYILYTVKPVYNERGYNECPLKAYRLHPLHRFLYKLNGHNENSLLTKAFGRTDVFVIDGFNCIYIYISRAQLLNHNNAN